MKQIPENSQDVKKLLYEQLPLLIERLRVSTAQDCLNIASAISTIMKSIQTIDH